MDRQLELSEVGTAANQADQQPSQRSVSAHRTQTILISFGCGVLQLPIWGVQSQGTLRVADTEPNN